MVSLDWAPPPVNFFVEHATALTKDLMLGALRQGPVPQHIAFVMDGNRRYARSRKQEVSEGHSAGFEALARTLEICYKIGVKVVTVYAFSIENFKRTRYEVDQLQDMAKLRLGQFAAHGQVLDRYGAKIQLLGRREMVRPDLLEAIDRAIDVTKHNTKAILNICAPYTSRDEMATAVQKTVAEFCQPIRPRLRRPFSETHIARNIQAQRLEALHPPPEQSPEPSNKENQLVTTKSESSQEDEDYVYKPTSPETTTAYSEMKKLVSQLLSEAADEHTATADESVVEGASASMLECLKDSSLTTEDKLAEVSDMLDSEIKESQLQGLQSIADRLTDYSTKTEVSESTTLNQNHEPISTPRPQPPAYPDVERITEDTLTNHTYTGIDTPPLDLLVRTSGVERLSDFMLWQCHQSTEIAFVNCYWPEFGLRHIIPLILEWQWKQKKESSLKDSWQSRQKLS